MTVAFKLRYTNNIFFVTEFLIAPKTFLIIQDGLKQQLEQLFDRMDQKIIETFTNCNYIGKKKKF